jgi:hypothetical protein
MSPARGRLPHPRHRPARCHSSGSAAGAALEAGAWSGSGVTGAPGRWEGGAVTVNSGTSAASARHERARRVHRAVADDVAVGAVMLRPLDRDARVGAALRAQSFEVVHELRPVVTLSACPITSPSARSGHRLGNVQSVSTASATSTAVSATVIGESPRAPLAAQSRTYRRHTPFRARRDSRGITGHEGIPNIRHATTRTEQPGFARVQAQGRRADTDVAARGNRPTDATY